MKNLRERLQALIIVVGLFLPNAAKAQSPDLHSNHSNWVVSSQSFSERNISYGKLAVGASLGVLAGTAAGVLLGQALSSNTGESWVGMSNTMAAGFVIGTTLGGPVGVGVTTDWQSDFAIQLGTSVLLSIASVLLMEERPLFGVILPVGHVAAGIVIGKLTL